MLKVAIIGCGKHAKNFHLPSFLRLKNKFQVIGLYDPIKANANNLAKKFNISKIYSSIDELLSDSNVDLIDICSPPKFHYFQILKSIKSKKDIIVEKPLVIKKKQVIKIEKRLLKTNIKLMCLQHQRFRPETKTLKKLIISKKKQLGKMFLIKSYATYSSGIPKQINYSFTNKKISGGGPLIDHGSHLIDMAIFLTGLKRVTKLNSTLFYNFIKNNQKIFNVEERCHANFIIDKKIFFSFETSYVSPKVSDDFRMTFYFENGFIEWPRLKYSLNNKNKFKFKNIKSTKILASDEQFNHVYDLIINNKKPIIKLSESKILIDIIEKLYERAIIIKK